MTECGKRDTCRNPRHRAGVEQIAFSFARGIKPTLVFDAEAITTDAGLAPLRELDERLGLSLLAAGHVEDLRLAEMTVHPILRLIRETVYAYAAGYEDANDHSPLARDAWFKELIGEINKKSVNPKRHDGLASEATISRLLNGRKLGRGGFGFAHLEQFARVIENNPPRVITLDIDGYDAEAHGRQQLSLFNGYFDEEMYYPLVVSAAEYGFVVAAILRPGNAGANEDAVPLLRLVLEFFRERFPKIRLRLRGDSGFMDPELYRLSEEFGVEYAVRARMNAVLKRLFEADVEPRVENEIPVDKRAERWTIYHETTYRAGSWKRPRRIVMKLTHNPEAGQIERYVVVTNSRKSPRNVWNFYAHRGQCEQRIDELKNHLRGEKFSCPEFHANAFKLHLVVMAHNLYAAARIFLPREHELKRATVGRLRLVLVKCGAVLRRTARRLWIHASKTWPHRHLLADVSRRFVSAPLVPVPLWDAG